MPNPYAVELADEGGTVREAGELTFTDAANQPAPGGAASGDLAGTYPGPTVAAVNGVAVSGAAGAGKLLVATGAAAASWQAAGMLRAYDFTFTERATAGTYTATLDLLAGTFVWETYLIPLAVKTLNLVGWAADTAALTMGDTTYGASFYYNAYDLVGSLIAPYDPPTAFVNSNFANLGDLGTPASAAIPFGTIDGGPGIYYPAADTLTMTVATTIAAPPVVPAGVLLVRVVLLMPSAATAAAFA